MNSILQLMSNTSYTSKLYYIKLKPIRKKYNLTQIEVDILAFLNNNPEFNTASDIVRYRMLTKSNVSQGVELLISKGMLNRENDIKDKRIVRLKIQDKADEMVEDIIKRQIEFFKVVFNNFTDKQKEEYVKSSMQITKNVKRELEAE